MTSPGAAVYFITVTQIYFCGASLPSTLPLPPNPRILQPCVPNSPSVLSSPILTRVLAHRCHCCLRLAHQSQQRMDFCEHRSLSLPPTHSRLVPGLEVALDSCQDRLPALPASFPPILFHSTYWSNLAIGSSPSSHISSIASSSITHWNDARRYIKYHLHPFAVPLTQTFHQIPVFLAMWNQVASQGSLSRISTPYSS